MRNDWLKGWGLGLTVCYLSGIAFLIVTNWNDFSELDPNEWGDFLAGSFGPLALAWIVLGFFQQGRELQNSVKALELQAEQLQASAEQQAELVNVTREALDAEKAAYQEAKEVHLDQQKPIVQALCYPAPKNPRDFMVVKISNTGGGTAEHIRGSIRDGEFFLKTIDINCLPRGESAEYFLGNNPSLGGFGLSDRTIELTYQDQRGEVYKSNSSF